MGTPHGIIINVLWVWVVSYHFHVAVYQNPPKFPPAKCFPCTARKSLSRVSSNTRFWNTQGTIRRMASHNLKEREFRVPTRDGWENQTAGSVAGATEYWAGARRLW